MDRELLVTTYHGEVRGGVIVLPDGVHLDDGLKVEIHVVTPPGDRSEEVESEELFKQRLLEAGLLSEIRRPSPAGKARKRVPIRFKGKPLSRLIIDERR